MQFYSVVPVTVNFSSTMKLYTLRKNIRPYFLLILGILVILNHYCNDYFLGFTLQAFLAPNYGLAGKMIYIFFMC